MNTKNTEENTKILLCFLCKMFAFHPICHAMTMILDRMISLLVCTICISFMTMLYMSRMMHFAFLVSIMPYITTSLS